MREIGDNCCPTEVDVQCQIDEINRKIRNILDIIKTLNEEQTEKINELEGQIKILQGQIAILSLAVVSISRRAYGQFILLPGHRQTSIDLNFADLLQPLRFGISVSPTNPTFLEFTQDGLYECSYNMSVSNPLMLALLFFQVQIFVNGVRYDAANAFTYNIPGTLRINMIDTFLIPISLEGAKTALVSMSLLTVIGTMPLMDTTVDRSLMCIHKIGDLSPSTDLEKLTI
ncbi:MAG: hypothetical protein Harvfovirus68_6 [Harvfovirus sp.]|uniref:Uncharacterized protein n=1 Tax=Harvfovirus sp. TaxID=2487768 RepID=A0A3G5A3N6_9VIRU|nr:MAG: hypothetical protein Harvfovirus68_6 [Harvfovirus sp.]